MHRTGQYRELLLTHVPDEACGDDLNMLYKPVHYDSRTTVSAHGYVVSVFCSTCMQLCLQK